MLYHQQFKGLTHVIISCFTSVEFIMVPNSLIDNLQSEKFHFNKITMSVVYSLSPKVLDRYFIGTFGLKLLLLLSLTDFPGNVADVMVTLSPT